MEAIEHYKKKLLRHVEEPDTVLYCLKKLETVPVTMEILQDTEVGKVVNRLKKRPDATPDVINASKALVEKWKELVKNSDEVDQGDQRSISVPERKEAVTTHSSSKTSSGLHHGSEKKSSSSTSSSSKHHKKDKKEKREKEKEKEKTHHKHHHKSHKSSSKDKSTSSSSFLNGTSSSSSHIEIPSDINPNYKPPKVRHFPTTPAPTHSRNGSSKPSMNTDDDDALSQMMAYAKSQRFRTAVYSGRKTSAFTVGEKFPTLAELCVHVLQDNVSRIDECGSASFDMLKPILERAKPDDLIRIEDFNPKLTEDTGELWKAIIKRHFPKGEREEFESYREMYERLILEREEKLDKLMGKVKNKYNSIKTSNTQTKYVASVVAKPPRGVKRAQEKNGTFVPLNSSLDRVKKARMSSSSFRESPSTSASAVKKAKVAPMMAKTLKMVRGLKSGGMRR